MTNPRLAGLPGAEHAVAAAEFFGTPARELSREADYGVMWTLPGRAWPQWRVSYIEATGEVYARQQGGAAAGQELVIVLGAVTPVPHRPHMQSRAQDCTLRDKPWYRPLDELLGDGDPEHGWAAQRDLSWLAARLAGTCTCGTPAASGGGMGSAHLNWCSTLTGLPAVAEGTPGG